MDWGAILIAALTGGAVVAVVQAVANRPLVKARAEKAVSEAADVILTHYRTCTDELSEKVVEQSQRIEALQEQVRELRGMVDQREDIIEELEKVKQSQQVEIEKLQIGVKQRDQKIAEQSRTIERLATRVTELEAALKRLQDGTPG